MSNKKNRRILSDSEFFFCKYCCVCSWLTSIVFFPMLTSLTEDLSAPVVSMIAVVFFLYLVWLTNLVLNETARRKEPPAQNAESKLPSFYTIREVPEDPSDPNSPLVEKIVLVSGEDLLKGK